MDTATIRRLVQRHNDSYNFMHVNRPMCFLIEDKIVATNKLFNTTFSYSSQSVPTYTPISNLFTYTEAAQTELLNDGFQDGMDLLFTPKEAKNDSFQVRIIRISFENELFYLCDFSNYVDVKATFDTLIFKTENPLTERDIKYNNLYDSTFGPLMVVGFDGLIKYVNAAYCNFMGSSETEIIGRHYNFATAQEFQVSNNEAFRAALQGEMKQNEINQVIGKNGASKWIYYNTVPDMEEEEILVSIRDITKVIELKNVLKEKEKKLERKEIALVETMESLASEKEKIKERISANINSSVLPIIHKIESSSDENQLQLLSILKQSLQEICGEFGVQTLKSSAELSVKETEVCQLLKQGLSNKEIADLLTVSLETVQSHRKNIRKKLGLSNTRQNLITYLRMHM